MKISGKVNYKGEIKKYTKGCGRVFKIDSFDENLSVWGFDEKALDKKTDFEIGDIVEVEYEENGDFNSVKKVGIVEEQLQKTSQELPENLKWTTNDIDIRRMSLDICIMTLGRLEPKKEAVTELVEMAQYIEHYLRSGEKFGEFKEAGK